MILLKNLVYLYSSPDKYGYTLASMTVGARQMRLISCENGKANDIAAILHKMRVTDLDGDYYWALRIARIQSTIEFRDKVNDTSEIEGFQLFVILCAQSEEEMKHVIQKIESIPFVISTREWEWTMGIRDQDTRPQGCDELE